MTINRKPGALAGIFKKGTNTLLKVQTSASLLRNLGWSSSKTLTQTLVRNKTGYLKKISISVAKNSKDGYRARPAPTRACRFEIFFPLNGFTLPCARLGSLEIKRSNQSLNVMIEASKPKSETKSPSNQLNFQFSEVEDEL